MVLGMASHDGVWCLRPLELATVYHHAMQPPRHRNWWYRAIGPLAGKYPRRRGAGGGGHVCAMRWSHPGQQNGGGSDAGAALSDTTTGSSSLFKRSSDQHDDHHRHPVHWHCEHARFLAGAQRHSLLGPVGAQTQGSPRSRQQKCSFQGKQGHQPWQPGCVPSHGDGHGSQGASLSTHRCLRRLPRLPPRARRGRCTRCRCRRPCSTWQRGAVYTVFSNERAGGHPGATRASYRRTACFYCNKALAELSN
eukprot:COSAG01_NODE_296_length_19281_cov_212.029507_10_plen_250_part_00